MKISMVYLLWVGDTEKAHIENVFIDKVLAETALRHMKAMDDGRGYVYWIQEKELTN